MKDFLPVQCTDILHSIALLVRQARLEQGLRQIDLSERTGSSPRTVRRIEAGDANGVALGDFLMILWTLGISDRAFRGLSSELTPMLKSEAIIGKKRVRIRSTKAEDF